MALRLKEKKPKTQVQVTIRRQKEKSISFMLAESSVAKVLNGIKDILRAKGVDPFSTGYTTSITAVVSVGAKRSGAKTISFKGLSVEQTYSAILAGIRAQPDEEAENPAEFEYKIQTPTQRSKQIQKHEAHT